MAPLFGHMKGGDSPSAIFKLFGFLSTTPLDRCKIQDHPGSNGFLKNLNPVP